MNKFLYKLFLIVIAASLGLISALLNPDLGYAQESKTVKKNGLNFILPDDWPIEKRNGIVGPIPTEEYMAMKFKKTNEAMDEMKKDYGDKIKALEERIMELEEKLDRQIASAKTQPAVSGGGTGAVSSDTEGRLEELETQLMRLDRKITNNIQALKIEFQNKTLSVDKFDDRIKDLRGQIKALDGDIEYLYGNVQIKQ